MPLVDLAAIVGLPQDGRGTGAATAIVVRAPSLAVAARIDGTGRVIDLGAGDALRPAERDDVPIEGFVQAGEGGVIAVLDAEELFARLNRLRLRNVQVASRGGGRS
jgi:chemotaxis signal transduction protein